MSEAAAQSKADEEHARRAKRAALKELNTTQAGQGV